MPAQSCAQRRRLLKVYSLPEESLLKVGSTAPARVHAAVDDHRRVTSFHRPCSLWQAFCCYPCALFKHYLFVTELKNRVTGTPGAVTPAAETIELNNAAVGATSGVVTPEVPVAGLAGAVPGGQPVKQKKAEPQPWV